jgi:hypothetical protein
MNLPKGWLQHLLAQRLHAEAKQQHWVWSPPQHATTALASTPMQRARWSTCS